MTNNVYAQWHRCSHDGDNTSFLNTGDTKKTQPDFENTCQQSDDLGARFIINESAKFEFDINQMTHMQTTCAINLLESGTYYQRSSESHEKSRHLLPGNNVFSVNALKGFDGGAFGVHPLLLRRDTITHISNGGGGTAFLYYI